MEIFKNKLVRISYSPETNVATAVYNVKKPSRFYMEAISNGLEQINRKDPAKWLDMLDEGMEYNTSLAVLAEDMWRMKAAGSKKKPMVNNSVIREHFNHGVLKKKNYRKTEIFEGLDNISNWIKSRD